MRRARRRQRGSRFTYADLLQNRTLDQLVFRHVRKMLPLAYSEEELAYAERFHAVGNPEDWKTYQGTSERVLGERGKGLYQGVMADGCIPPTPIKSGSTDVGDVSWVLPTSWFVSACWALGSPAHSWQAVAQGKSLIAHRGMTAAATIIARSALDIFAQPEVVDSMWAELVKARDGAEYQPLIGKDVMPGSF